MKHLFIVNPIAGGKNRSAEIRKKAAELLPQGADFEVYTTRAPMDAAEKIRAEARVIEDLRVYSVGGDGTFNECVNGAAGLSNVAVGICPGGTGNDFVRMFGEDAALMNDLKSVLDGEVRPIDIISCNGRYGVNICSVGIDARIGIEVHDYSRIPLVGGKLAYVTSAIVNVFKGLNQPLKISYDGVVREGEFALVCICNGQYYGGGFNPVPDARPDDGMLDIIIVGKITKRVFAQLILKYAKGRYREISDKYLTYLRGKSIKIESRDEIYINLDGEALRGKTAEFRIVPGGVNCIFPKGMRFFENENEKTE